MTTRLLQHVGGVPLARKMALPWALLAMGSTLGCRDGRTAPPATPPSEASVADSRGASPSAVLTGEAALGDFTSDAPGVKRRITLTDLPPPYATTSADNDAHVIDRPEGAWPRVPPGFRVDLFASGLTTPRMLRVAPNGDVFVVESKIHRVSVLRDANGGGKADTNEVFADGLHQPFGVNFYPSDAPRFVYVANTDSVVRFPYGAGDTKSRGAKEVVVDDLSGGGRLRGGGHWTRDVVFSRDDAHMFVSVGSRSNVNDDDAEARRARIFEYTPAGKNERVFATGIRNAVGLAVHPVTGELWTSVNERDELGDHLVPDYVTSVRDGGFYGWPWFYIGNHQDPRHEGKHPELRERVIVPDVLVQSHSASLGMMFYTGKAFPETYRLNAFAAEHGSWNRTRRTGYKVIALPMTPAGKATGEYVDFMTGFVTPTGDVWGRPVAVAETRDGALLVSDDAGGVIWRIAYLPNAAPSNVPAR